jgi:hypothetical protein
LPSYLERLFEELADVWRGCGCEDGIDEVLDAGDFLLGLFGVLDDLAPSDVGVVVVGRSEEGTPSAGLPDNIFICCHAADGGFGVGNLSVCESNAEVDFLQVAGGEDAAWEAVDVRSNKAGGRGNVRPGCMSEGWVVMVTGYPRVPE